MTVWARNCRFVTASWKKLNRVNVAPLRYINQCRICFAISRSGFDNYERERATWGVEIPPKFNFASDVLDVWAQKEKDGQRTTSIPAFWFVYENGKEIKWSFQDLERETKKVANMLLLYGINRGDPVLLMLPKIPEFWLISIAAMRIGAITCPATTQLTAKDLAYRISSYRPTCFIAHENVAEVVKEATSSCTDMKKILVCDEPKKSQNGILQFHTLYNTADPNHECVKTDSDETMMVFFTSGTTGFPKMVEHSHSSYGIGHQSTGKYILDLTSDCILWNMSDTGWAKTAYSNIFAPWRLGACVFVHQMPRFHPVQTLEILSQYPIDTFCAPPMAYRTMVHENLKAFNFPALAHCITGGEALNPEVNKLWKEGTGLDIYEAYGQTESVILTGMFRCLKYKSGSIGKASPGQDIVVIDEKENEVDPGVEGEIAIKRSSDRIFGLFKGYRGEPEMTKNRLTDKYFHTGDLGYRDQEGYFYFVGRKDDLINSAGYRIGPVEVESALMEHPAVVEVAVTSSPDKERGEVVKAFIVLKKNYKVESESELIKELQEHSKNTTAPYKYPRKIEFVAQLPKTASGKIKRFELRKKEWEKEKK